MGSEEVVDEEDWGALTCFDEADVSTSCGDVAGNGIEGVGHGGGVTIPRGRRRANSGRCIDAGCTRHFHLFEWVVGPVPTRFRAFPNV